MARMPILPSKPTDPAGVDRLERGAMLEFARRIKRCKEAYIDALGRIPGEPVVNKNYTFRLDPFLLTSVLAAAGLEVESQLQSGGPENVWFFELYVSAAYARGTAQQYANISQQSPAYSAGQDSLATIIRSDPYRRRVALVAAREYEEMQGLTGTVKANMSRILTDGIGRGLNPKVIAKGLTTQAGIEASRANRIARTEIPTALRRARLDEAEEAQERYGIASKEMHYSALSPTTRITHAKRHGNLYTIEQQREWWAEGANSINCKCSTITVLVNEKGEPVVPAIVERARQTEKIMKAKGRGPWATEE